MKEYQQKLYIIQNEIDDKQVEINQLNENILKNKRLKNNSSPNNQGKATFSVEGPGAKFDMNENQANSSYQSLQKILQEVQQIKTIVVNIPASSFLCILEKEPEKLFFC